ncbi:MAG TPA: glycosyltransferase [Candidatus Saccharimonadales bacterium]
MTKKLRVAIVHDWLYGGGAERVIHELHKMFPDAPIYTSYCSDDWRKKLDGKVITGFLQHWPLSRLRKFLPVLRIWWFTHLDFSGYDLVISSSGNGEAFGIHTPKDTVHINYCHTPTHYYWRHYEEYLKRPGFGLFDPLARFGLKLLVKPLRKWDFSAAQRPDYFIANSTHIQNDIKKYYGRESVVIHPPIDIERFDVPAPKKRDGLIIAGRQVPQKKFDLAIKACNKLSMPLKVLGKGPEHKRLVAMAGPSITFIEHVSDGEMPQFIAGAKAFIFPSYEDFGITPIEALAAGTPVIAYKAGGALDYVQEGKTGTFFAEQSIGSLCDTLKHFDDKTFNADLIKKSARAFSAQEFRRNMRHFIDECLRQARP